MRPQQTVQHPLKLSGSQPESSVERSPHTVKNSHRLRWNPTQMLSARWRHTGMERELASVSCAQKHMCRTCLHPGDHAGSKYPEIPRTCDKTRGMSNRFGPQGLQKCASIMMTTDRYKEINKDRERQEAENNTGCVVWKLFYLQRTDLLIDQNKRETAVGRTGIVPSPQRTALFFHKGHKWMTFGVKKKRRIKKEQWGHV